ncbi:hypothetical protein [Amycolatopsis sp. w19]|uniref:hypothetical protein n=1 Tax=Amycolatopsis sp. w19 TaxID=3448134 RepID=UPI003F1C69A6
MTLVSDLAAGKKRAAWESLWQSKGESGELLLGDWTVWPAASPSSPDALMDAARRALPRTAFFLPGLDRYLRGSDQEVGDRVARVLRETLSDPRRAPILIVATIRSGPLQELRLVSGKFPHAKLLVEGSEIRVPDEFSLEEMARASSSEDPRVAEASVRAAKDRYVVQYMLDVHDLQTRVDKASIIEGAILQWAIKARRLGNGCWLTRELLEKGTSASLHQKVQHIVGESGFDKAFAELVRRGPGGASVMIERDTLVLNDSRGPSYRLDDYLERRYVAGATDPVTLEPQLLQVLVEAADDSSLAPLAGQCRKRGLLYWAMRFYLRAAEGGDRSARLKLAEMLGQAGRVDDALDQYRYLADERDTEALILAAETLIAAGRNQDAVEWLKGMTEKRHDRATVLTARALERMNRHNEALCLYRELAERGNAAAAAVAADLMIDSVEGLARSAIIDEIVEWLTSLADRCGPSVVELATELLVDNQQVDSAMLRLKDYATSGRTYAWLLGAKVLFSQGRSQLALAWCQAAVKHKVAHAAAFAAKINAQLGLAEIAGEYALMAAEAGTPEALVEVGNVHAEKGLAEYALQCYGSAVDRGHMQALARIAEVYATEGKSDDSFKFYRQAQRAKCAPPASVIAAFLCDAGRVREAFEWYFKVLSDISNPDVIVSISDYLLIRKDESALSWDAVRFALVGYMKAAKVARPQAVTWLAEGLIRAGEEEARASVKQYDGKLDVPEVPSQKLVAAADLLNDAAIDGDVSARMKLVKLLARLNRHVEACRHLETIKKQTTVDVDVDMTISLAGQGKADEAMARLWSQLKKSNTKAVAPAAMFLMRHNCSDAAIEVLERGIELGDIESHLRLGDLKRFKRRYVDALDLYLFALLHGHPDAAARIRTLFTFNEDHHAQRDLRRYGITLDGQISEPWSVAADPLANQ